MRQFFVRQFFPALCLLLLLSACSSTSAKEEKAADARPAQELFEEGNAALAKDQYVTAAKAFDELVRLHPYADVAAQAQLNSAYARYLNEDYDEALVGFDQFLALHPSHPQAPYALYYKARCSYDQISDVSRDQDMTRRAMETLELVRARYPDSPEAKEAAIKLDLTRDHLAGKEMEIGRWYQRQDQLQAAIGRFRTVVDRYQTTSHVPEALHRLVESYTKLGLTEEARRTAAVLGYNFPGSPWYQDTYRVVADPSMPPADASTAADASDEPGWLARTVGRIF